MAAPTGFGERMQVDVGASDRSSSSLSPPISPPPADTIQVVGRPPFNNPQLSGEGVANPAAATPAHLAAAAQNGNTTSTVTAPAPEKPKKQRKKKEVGPDGKPIDDGKVKRTRKPKEPKEPKDKTTTSAPRKKQKTENLAHDRPAPSRQPTLTDMVHTFQTPSLPSSASQPPRMQHNNTLALPTSNSATPRPISSGQNYDPIRGYDPVRAATMDAAAAQPRPASTTNGNTSAQASPHINRASASPSIASLIDPPMAAKTSYFSQPPQTQPTTQPFVPRSPTLSKPTPATFAPTSPPVNTMKTTTATFDGAMDVDVRCEVPKAVEVKAPSKSSSSAPTPKAARAAPAAPRGTGSGLLSEHALFGGPSPNETEERTGVNIDIAIPLNPLGGNTINMYQEILKKYGRDAINPRAAAHRAALQKIAAAQNKLEGGSADDMSVDLMSEMGDDSNVEMGGMDDEKSGTGADGPVKPARKPRTKKEEYDKEDDFIDDTELAWEEQAAVAKGGFFVFSGPLVAPGETAQVESTTTTGRGRGRGRGRGSRGGATGGGTTHASLAEKKDPNAPPTRARGRGRGTGAPRKPRITKADRERMEAEKLDRERTAQNIGGPTGAPIALAPTPQLPAQPQYGQSMTTEA